MALWLEQPICIPMGNILILELYDKVDLRWRIQFTLTSFEILIIAKTWRAVSAPSAVPGWTARTKSGLTNTSTPRSGPRPPWTAPSRPTAAWPTSWRGSPRTSSTGQVRPVVKELELHTKVLSCSQIPGGLGHHG